MSKNFCQTSNTLVDKIEKMDENGKILYCKFGREMSNLLLKKRNSIVDRYDCVNWGEKKIVKFLKKAQKYVNYRGNVKKLLKITEIGYIL